MTKFPKDMQRKVLKRIPPLSKDALQRIELERYEEEGVGDHLTAPEAEFRVWTKDKQGREYAGPWIRPGGPGSRETTT